MEHTPEPPHPEEPAKEEPEYLRLTPDGDIDWKELDRRENIAEIKRYWPGMYYDLYATDEEREEYERQQAAASEKPDEPSGSHE